MHFLHFAVYLILSGIRVCDSSEPIMHSGHPVIIESGIHPCVDSINFAYLAFQGHCRRVTHSFRNVSPWTSLLLALSDDISLNPGPGSRSLNGCLLNVRSIRKKSASFLEFVKDNNADLIAVTETWLRPEDTESFISSITPPGYKFTHVPRNVKKGGGVGFFIKEDLSFEQVSKNSYQAFESISIQISTEGAKDVIFHVAYRPPNLSKSQFQDEFGMFLEGAALSGYENILLGDLNFHLDKHDTWTLKFYDILEQFSFTQLVNTPTHIQGHILDALCMRDSFSWAISPKVIGGLSDHQAIIFCFIFPVRESCKFQCVPIRKIHKINISDFRMDILKSDLIRCPYKTASLLSHQYFNTLRSLLDKHAPIMKKNIPRHAETGFMNCDILKAKRLKRKYDSNIVAENQGNSKALWNCFKKILHRSSVAVLPDYTNKTDLANTFCKFFYDKILKIRSTLQSSIPSSVTRPNSTKNTLSSFTPVSEEELLKMLKSSPSKSCDLDPIPTSLVKECADILITPITKIVNYSITEGSYCFKMAYVTPLQKKPSLDRNILKNYRPVSNLSFISKLIEKVVAK